MSLSRDNSLSMCFDSGYASASERQYSSTNNGDATQYPTKHQASDQVQRQPHKSNETSTSIHQQIEQSLNETDLAQILTSSTAKECFSRAESFILERVRDESLLHRLKASARHKTCYCVASKHSAITIARRWRLVIRHSDKRSLLWFFSLACGCPDVLHCITSIKDLTVADPNYWRDIWEVRH